MIDNKQKKYHYYNKTTFSATYQTAKTGHSEERKRALGGIFHLFPKAL